MVAAATIAARPSLSRQEVFDAVVPTVKRFAACLLAKRIPSVNASLRNDLVQEGLLELWKATEGYDHKLGDPVAACFPHARGAMLDWLRSQRETFGPSNRTVIRQKAASGFVPSRVPYSAARVELANPAPELSDDPAAEFAAHIHDIPAPLTPDDRECLVERFVHGRTLKEIGKRRGLTESRMCQVVNRALGLIREAMLAERAAHNLI